MSHADAVDAELAELTRVNTQLRGEMVARSSAWREEKVSKSTPHFVFHVVSIPGRDKYNIAKGCGLGSGLFLFASWASTAEQAVRSARKLPRATGQGRRLRRTVFVLVILNGSVPGTKHCVGVVCFVFRKVSPLGRGAPRDGAR